MKTLLFFLLCIPTEAVHHCKMPFLRPPLSSPPYSFRTHEVAAIAGHHVLSQNRETLEGILAKELPKLGFASPSNLSYQHPSLLAASALAVRVFQRTKDGKLEEWASYFFGAMRGYDADFFRFADRTNLGFFLFDNKMSDAYWSEALREAFLKAHLEDTARHPPVLELGLP